MATEEARFGGAKAAAKGFGDLAAEVINPGLCTLCGMCAGVCSRQAIAMRIEDYEHDEPVPTLVGECVPCGVCVATCPGRDVPLADLDKFVFGRERDPLGEPLGIYRCVLRGQGTGYYLTGSSSGGITLGVVAYALAEGVVDAAIIAVRDRAHPWRATSGIITSPAEARRGVRSVMEAVPVNEALHEAVMNRGYRRVGLVGVPCQVHALRKLQMKGTPRRLARAVTFCVGLFCNSTTYFIGVEHLIKEVGGVESLSEIVGLDYRAGAWPGAMLALTQEGKIHYIASKAEYGSFFSSANFRRDRCLMCIDFSSELADISTGDVFQQVSKDPRLTCVIVRTEIGEELIDGAVKKGFIQVEPHDPNLVLASGYGWEMSKHASMYRWVFRKEHGWPVPDFQYPPGIRILRRKLSSAR